jgi:flagellar hook protein FlgE
MLRSLFSGVSGLRNHQVWLDVVGNNVANANTPGYKASFVTFQEVLSQTLSAGAGPSDNQGGINPMQVGLGMSLGSITPSFLQGSIQTTNRATDLAIQGDGFFVLRNGNDLLYTRAGAFTLDSNGDLVEASTGFRVQGADGDIRINLGVESGATPTSRAVFKGNLDYTVDPGTEYVTTFNIRDSVGAAHTLTLTLTKASASAWDWAVTSSDGVIDTITGGSGTLVFDTDGSVLSGASQQLQIGYVSGSGITTPQPITLDFGTADNPTPVTGLASASTLTLASQDGLPTGTLQSFAIGLDGSITGFYTNGTTRTLGAIQLATFNNPRGLLRVGDNHFRESPNSGVASVGRPGTGGRGSITAGALEMSNVDLAQEFTAMIIAQTGFQANARTISTSDEMLRELVNLKR